MVRNEGACSTEDQLAGGLHSSVIRRQLRSGVAERTAPFLVFRVRLDRDLGVDRHRDRAAGRPDRPDLGGMMNAGFGNLPELIFGLIAIRNGLGPLAKA